MMKLQVNHFYRFSDNGEIMVGQYVGRDHDYSCCVCGKGHKAYEFNIFHGEDYETWAYGKEHLPMILEDLGE